MKIRLAILDRDQVYLRRLESVFNVKYADKLETFIFTDREYALGSLREKKIDVFLADETFDVEMTQLPSNCGFAYLVDTADIEKVKDAAAVCKFQKAETIYRQILGMFSEKTAAVVGARMEGEGAKTLAFVSAAGGTGSSVAAAACAMHFAQKGKKALYLNLEKFGSADVFFQAEGNTCLSDVIRAVKSRTGNLGMKLESTVKQDLTGVFFYSSARLALDIAELSAGETQQIVSVLKQSGGYDYIVLDLDFSLETGMLKLLEDVNDPDFGIQLDTNHLVAQHIDPEWSIYVLGGEHIFNVHCKDCDAVSRSNIPAGCGITDYTAVIEALKNVGYNGNLSVELEFTDNPRRYNRQALDHLKLCLAGEY